MRISFCALLLGALVAFDAATSRASIQMLPNADVNAANLLPASGPRLLHITTLSSGEAAGGIFTNQTSGSVASTGTVLSIAGTVINSAIDGSSFTTVVGPARTGQLVAVSVVQGSLTGSPAVDFTAGRLFIYEATQTFDSRNPSTWTAGALRGSFTLNAKEALLPNPFAAPNQGGGIGAGVSQANMNLSGIDPTLAGGALGNFLFAEDAASPGFLVNYI